MMCSIEAGRASRPSSTPPPIQVTRPPRKRLCSKESHLRKAHQEIQQPITPGKESSGQMMPVGKRKRHLGLLSLSGGSTILMFWAPTNSQEDGRHQKKATNHIAHHLPKLRPNPLMSDPLQNPGKRRLLKSLAHQLSQLSKKLLTP
jgi:hypothetical protein